MATLNYAQAGVNRELADQLVNRIVGMTKSSVPSRHKKKIRSTIGGYASLFEIDSKRWIAASTDGVGTKLKLAMQLGIHNTVGIDLVAMSVNDLLCVGAEPLFFLDYFATGKLQNGVAEQVIAGIVEGCKQGGLALVGGETAEMPDFYQNGEYDLGGFAVGMVNPSLALPAKKATGDAVKPGDVILGLPSSGFHSNGYSLVRKFVDNDQVARDCLKPTRIYTSACLPLIQKGLLKGLAHITGSGFLNVPRISDQVSYEITLPAWSKVPSVFSWIRHQSGLDLNELAQTFNLGVGMVLVVDPKKAAQVKRMLKRQSEPVLELGRVVKSAKKRDSWVKVRAESESCELHYGAS